MADRETWASRLGFILASVGSAVGPGNVWRFPFQTPTNGGAAFLVVFLLGVPSAWDTAWLGWFDGVAVNLFLPLAVLLVVAFVGWVLAEDAVDEVRQGTDLSRGSVLPTVWLWAVRSVVLLAVAGTLALGVRELLTPSGAYVVPPF